MKNRPNSPVKAHPMTGSVSVTSMFVIIAIKTKKVSTISIRTTISTFSHDSALKPNRDDIPRPMNNAPTTLSVAASMGHPIIIHNTLPGIRKYASPRMIATKKWRMNVNFKTLDIIINTPKHLTVMSDVRRIV